MAVLWDALVQSTGPQRLALSPVGSTHAVSRFRPCDVRSKDSALEGGLLKITALPHHTCRCSRLAHFSNWCHGSENSKWSIPASKGFEVPTDDGSEGNGDEDSRAAEEDPILDQALNLDGKIPSTSDGFVRTVSSRAYDIRRNLEQNIDASSYDVLDANPWRESSKAVYVLAKEEDQLLTMRTRRERSEVERELRLLFPKRGSRRGKRPPRPEAYENVWTSAPTNTESRFRLSVEDVREGVLVFEDEEEATRYCSLLDGQGKSCMGVAEFDASDVFAMCEKTRALAVVFRRGQTPPQPDRLQLNLKARKRSLED